MKTHIKSNRICTAYPTGEIKFFDKHPLNN